MTNGQRTFINGALAATSVVLGVLNFKNLFKVVKLSVNEFKRLGK